MGNEADGGDFLVGIGRDAGHHIAVFVEMGLYAHGLQLVAKHAQQVELALGAGLCFRIFVGGGLHGDVSQEFVQ